MKVLILAMAPMPRSSKTATAMYLPLPLELGTPCGADGGGTELMAEGVYEK